MSIRDEILTTAPADLRSEVIDMPTWRHKVVIREMTVKDRAAYFKAITDRVEVSGGYEYIDKDDGLNNPRLIVACAFDEDGERIFLPEDVDWLSNRPASEIDLLAAAAQRLSGVTNEAVDEAGKASDPTTDDSSSSS